MYNSYIRYNRLKNFYKKNCFCEPFRYNAKNNIWWSVYTESYPLRIYGEIISLSSNGENIVIHNKEEDKEEYNNPIIISNNLGIKNEIVLKFSDKKSKKKYIKHQIKKLEKLFKIMIKNKCLNIEEELYCSINKLLFSLEKNIEYNKT